jgi:predicted ArsR family transcriptional regulator
MSYYNTNKEVGRTLAESQGKAQRQRDKVLEIFRSKKNLTASEAWKIYGINECPITSIRRAITDLYNEGLLFKTEKTAKGMYGKAEHVYSTENPKQPKFGRDGQIDLFQ